MHSLLDFFRWYRARQRVRPWAMATPLLLLLIALPLLRPLRSPTEISDNELSRLATVQAIVERRTLVINDTGFFQTLCDRSKAADLQAHPTRAGNDVHPHAVIKIGNDYYSDRPPVMAIMLAGIYSLLYRAGLTFADNGALVAYLLTLIGVTIPVAGAGGLLYKMGRLFELPRPARAALAAAVVFGSGLASYAVAINPHAPAASLVLASCACLYLLSQSKRPSHTGAWFAIAGLSAALAAVIDPTAGIFLVLLIGVILALPWRRSLRAGGMMLYAIGAVPPLLLHLTLLMSVTGDARPGFLHPEFSTYAPTKVTMPTITAPPVAGDDDTPDDRPSWVRMAAWPVVHIVEALVGARGLFSHYPILIIGLMGMSLVLRRHWPAPTKMLATVSLMGACVIVGVYALGPVDWQQAMFGPRWFIVFLPLLLFWGGAWLRKTHGPVEWSIAGTLLAFSVFATLIGMTDPFISARGAYSPYAAAKHLVSPAPPPATTIRSTTVAGAAQ